MKLFIGSMAAVLAAAIAVPPASAQGRQLPSGAELLKEYNKDGDTTFEIPEVIALSQKTFDAINPDGDTTLERDETEGRLSEKDWKRVNKDGDETLEMDEWLKITRDRYKRADKNKDGKISAEELDSKPGRALAAMIAK